MTGTAQLIIYCALILGASLAGGAVPLMVRLTHTRLQVTMSLVAGLMLGVGLFHMLPHAAAETRSLDQAVWWLMIGLLITFFLQRFFHFHQHGPLELEDDRHIHAHEHHHDHDGPCDHDHHHGHAHGGHGLNWLGIAVGLTVHTLMDGIALAASVDVEAALATKQDLPGLYGVATFLAIVLHKPLDAMAITSLMTGSGWSLKWRTAVNAAFALVVPLGALLFHLGLHQVSADQHVFVGCALALSAGAFLCISLSDLLPEVQFHSHDRLKLSAALLVGILLAYAIGFIEAAGHGHGDGHGGHSHAGH